MATTMSRPKPEPISKPPRQLPFPLSLYQTAVGKKWVMALTGIGLLGFVLAHMIGNLHLYEGPVELREYAETLRDIGTEVIPRTWFLWGFRLGLIAMFALHIHAAYTLKAMSVKANPSSSVLDGTKKYEGGQDFIAVNFAGRTMVASGTIVGLFIVYHLADLTWGVLPWVDYERGDPYHNVVSSLENWPVALLYIVANILLAMHIFHGTWSLFQSLGINNPRYNGARRAFAGSIAAVILIGNLSFPILVQAGLVDEDNCTAPCGITGEEVEAEEAGQ